jgi:membrane protein implicated in regulation of membrane protease activity
LKFRSGINTLRIMGIKPPSKAITQYTVYALIGTLLELGILVAIIVWGLPYAGIDMPLWAVIVLAIIVLVFSGYTYTTGRRALNKKLLNEIGSMIGSTGTVSVVDESGGYVKIGGELWKAISESRLNTGEEVVVVNVEGLYLIVESKRDKKQAGFH